MTHAYHHLHAEAEAEAVLDGPVHSVELTHCGRCAWQVSGMTEELLPGGRSLQAPLPRTQPLGSCKTCSEGTTKGEPLLIVGFLCKRSELWPNARRQAKNRRVFSLCCVTVFLVEDSAVRLS